MVWSELAWRSSWHCQGPTRTSPAGLGGNFALFKESNVGGLGDTNITRVILNWIGDSHVAFSPTIIAPTALSRVIAIGLVGRESTGNPSKTRSATLFRSRWQDSDASDASCLINRLPRRSAPTTRIAREELNAARRLLKAL
jgi:hypothetical protein